MDEALCALFSENRTGKTKAWNFCARKLYQSCHINHSKINTIWELSVGKGSRLILYRSVRKLYSPVMNVTRQSLFQSFSIVNLVLQIREHFAVVSRLRQHYNARWSRRWKLPKTTNWSDGLSKNSNFFAVIFFSVLRMAKNSPVLHRKAKPKTYLNINAGQTTSSSKNAAYVMWMINNLDCIYKQWP